MSHRMMIWTKSYEIIKRMFSSFRSWYYVMDVDNNAKIANTARSAVSNFCPIPKAVPREAIFTAMSRRQLYGFGFFGAFYRAVNRLFYSMLAFSLRFFPAKKTVCHKDSKVWVFFSSCFSPKVVSTLSRAKNSIFLMRHNLSGFFAILTGKYIGSLPSALSIVSAYKSFPCIGFLSATAFTQG